MFGSNYDPNNDQQSSADSDLLGNNTNAMLQAQTATIAGDTVYYYRVRVGSLANGNGSSSFYLALDLNGTGSLSHCGHVCRSKVRNYWWSVQER